MKPLQPVAIVLAILAAFTLWRAGDSLVLWITESSPTQMTMTAYLQSPPKQRWLKLTDCNVAYGKGVIYRDVMHGDISHYEIPVYASNDSTQPTRLIVQRLNPTPAEMEQLPREDCMSTIQGVVHPVRYLEASATDLRGHWDLADDYSVMAINDEPSKVKAFGGLALAIAMAIGAVWCWKTAAKTTARGRYVPRPLAAMERLIRRW